MDRLVGMIDAGFLTRSASYLLGTKTSVEGEEIVRWLKIVSRRLNQRYLRSYWYDGAYPASHGAEYQTQRDIFEKLEGCSGLQLRLGHLESRKFDFKPALKAATADLGVDYDQLINKMQLGRIFQQKGVDTLIVLDMMRLVQQKACSTIVLIAGDRDLAEAVRTVQELGATVILAHPEFAPISTELRDLADDRVILTRPVIERFTTKVSERQRILFEKVIRDHGYDEAAAIDKD